VAALFKARLAVNFENYIRANPETARASGALTLIDARNRMVAAFI
jgi:hypothetical protein